MSKSCWDTRYNPFLAEFCKLDSLRSLLKTDVHLANCKKKLWQVIGEIVCDIAKKKSDALSQNHVKIRVRPGGGRLIWLTVLEKLN